MRDSEGFCIPGILSLRRLEATIGPRCDEMRNIGVRRAVCGTKPREEDDMEKRMVK